MDCDILCEEIWKLNGLLGRDRYKCYQERNRRIQLCNEVNETKKQLTYQKTLTNVYTREQGKKTKTELQKYSNAKTLSLAKIATKMWDINERKQKKVLLKDYENLQVAHLFRQDKLMAELQEEREKNKFLQDELEKIRALSHEVDLLNETFLKIKLQSEILQQELEKEIKSQTDSLALMSEKEYPASKHGRGDHKDEKTDVL